MARAGKDLFDHRLLLLFGCGGVGKTTVAAALAVAAAHAGRRTAVLTIDPSRRLKDALGLRNPTASPHRVKLDRPPGARPRGSLDALILDSKRTFDEVVRRSTPDPRLAERLLGNPLYRSLSTALEGSQEYTAMEKVYELLTAADYDLVLVDTPPAAHALAFLEAPRRMLALLDSRALRLVQSPASVFSRSGSRLTQLVLGAILRGLERFTGAALLRDLADFMASFHGLAAAFRSRAQDFDLLLRDEQTAAVLLTAPDPATCDATETFYRELISAGVPVTALVVNRALPAAAPASPGPPHDLALPGGLWEKLSANYADLRVIAERDHAAVEALRAATDPRLSCRTVPAFEREPATVGELLLFADHLLETDR